MLLTYLELELNFKHWNWKFVLWSREAAEFKLALLTIDRYWLSILVQLAMDLIIEILVRLLLLLESRWRHSWCVTSWLLRRRISLLLALALLKNLDLPTVTERRNHLFVKITAETIVLASAITTTYYNILLQPLGRYCKL